VLYSFWAASYIAFSGDVVRELAAQFLALAEKQGATIPRMIGHRLMGISLACTGDIAEGRAHFDQAFALYDPAVHRPLATRFSVDTSVSVLRFRSLALWLLGYPDAALEDADQALKDAREIGQAGNFMFALVHTSHTFFLCGSLREGEYASRRTCHFGGRKGRRVLEGERNEVARLRIGHDRQSRSRSPNNHLRTCRVAGNWSDSVGTVVLITFDESL
jgi:tetratricopeptide (TPR) repeat protein